MDCVVNEQVIHLLFQSQYVDDHCMFKNNKDEDDANTYGKMK